MMTLKYPVLLVTSLLLQYCCANFDAPTRVIGVFQNQVCAPAIAASLAVEFFNKLTGRSVNFDFSYESIPKFNISTEQLNNSVIVTDDSLVCEMLAVFLVDMGSFLIYQGPPTLRTLEMVKNNSNLILVGHNPSALVHCLFKLDTLIYERNGKKSSPISLMFSEDHPYEHVEYELFQNLRSAQIPVYELPIQSTEYSESFPANKSVFDVPIINSFVTEKDATKLLCRLHHNNRENQSVIFVGLPSEHLQWFRSTDEINEARDTESLVLCDKTETQESFNCTQKQLRKAVQDHLFLKHFVPGWTTGENEDLHITRTKSALNERIQTAGAFLDYDDALLTYDSVWAVLKAINRASRGEITEGSVGKALINKSFTGISGEKISFVKYKNGIGGYTRNATEATITIYRFKEEGYIPIGRHFNLNSSFYWIEHLFPVGGHKGTRESKCTNPLPHHEPNRIRIGIVGILMISCVLLLSTLLLLMIALHCLRLTRWKRVAADVK